MKQPGISSHLQAPKLHWLEMFKRIPVESEKFCTIANEDEPDDDQLNDRLLPTENPKGEVPNQPAKQ